MSIAAYKGIGNYLKNAREKQKLSLDDVQSGIKIHRRFLSALEDENFSVLPGEAYIKPFLRAYCEFLGVEIDVIQYEKIYGDDRKRGETQIAASKDSYTRRWLQVGIFFIVGIAAIVVFGEKSNLVDKYTIHKSVRVRQDVFSTTAAASGLLIELMAFDSAKATVISDRDTLFNGELQRGDVIRYRNKDFYQVSIFPARNVRIFASGYPLYFPQFEREEINVMLEKNSVLQYRDSLLLGETVR